MGNERMICGEEVWSDDAVLGVHLDTAARIGLDDRLRAMIKMAG